MTFKSFFPLIENCTYLNTAASGLLPKSVLESKLQDLKKFHEQGSGYLSDESEMIYRTKTRIAKVFNAKIDRIGITPNFSLAYNAVLDGFAKETRFLCLEEDYLSVIMPIKTRGFQHHTLSISAEIENDIYEYISEHRPDVLALSIVQYLSGIKITVDFFAMLKADFPDLKIIVDATQYLGTEDFDFKTSGIDLLISSCYKWLSAGYGNAITLISDELYETLSPKQVGSNSYPDKVNLKPSPMGFLEPGHYDLNTIVALETALEFHYHTIGIETIQAQIRNLSSVVFKELKALNLLEDTVKRRPVHSNIFMLDIGQEKFEAFEKANIILSKRGQGLRISFHYFNTFDDLERLIDFLKA